jgi:hypothetical protein
VPITISTHNGRPERPQTKWNLYKKDFKTLHEVQTNMVKRVHAGIEEEDAYWKIFVPRIYNYLLQLFNCIILL